MASSYSANTKQLKRGHKAPLVIVECKWARVLVCCLMNFLAAKYRKHELDACRFRAQTFETEMLKYQIVESCKKKNCYDLLA